MPTNFYKQELENFQLYTYIKALKGAARNLTRRREKNWTISGSATPVGIILFICSFKQPGMWKQE